MEMSLKGTPLNMAPELLIGDGNADSKVDIWSAGVVLFQLVAHEYPIKAKSIPELQKQIQLGTLNRPIIIKDDLFWDLLVNLLSFDRTKRFSAEQALQHPYFTSTQALNEISQESHQIATSAQLAKSNGDTNITIYDIDPSYSLNGTEIKTALNYDPEIDLQLIFQQIKQTMQQQEINQPQNSSNVPSSALTIPPPILLPQNPNPSISNISQVAIPGQTVIFSQPPIKQQPVKQNNINQQEKQKEKEKENFNNNQDDFKIPCEICNNLISFNQYQEHIEMHQKSRNVSIIKDQDPNRKEQERLKREQEEKDQQFALQLQEEENKQRRNEEERIILEQNQIIKEQEEMDLLIARQLQENDKKNERNLIQQQRREIQEKQKREQEQQRIRDREREQQQERERQERQRGGGRGVQQQNRGRGQGVQIQQGRGYGRDYRHAANDTIGRMDYNQLIELGNIIGKVNVGMKENV